MDYYSDVNYSTPELREASRNLVISVAHLINDIAREPDSSRTFYNDPNVEFLTNNLVKVIVELQRMGVTKIRTSRNHLTQEQ